ncbi:MAG: sigma-54 dependent transcriptional regulator [bacterium]
MTTHFTLYVVDDEQSIRDGLETAFADAYRVRTFATGEDALAALKADPPDLVLLDIGLPGMNGIEVLRETRRTEAEALVIMITAYEDVATAVSAMKLGAHDYIVKPLQMDSLEVTIRNALDTIRLRKEIQALQERSLKESIPGFIGESEALQEVMELIRKVARSPNTPVLITGETGTGKELVARAIHFWSPNFNGPLVTVNCASLPKDLVESELFGYEKGAFSGASLSGKKGLIEEAARGTLFLDEVGDLSPEAQAKLLRFLEEGEFYRLGSTRKIQVRTRVVSATNQDLDELMKKGAFRKDLYFRLGVIRVKVPSLNERRDGILPLAKHFLVHFGKEFGRTFTGFTPEAEQALKSREWTGNVRELRNVIERAALTGRGPELTAGDLGLEGDVGGRAGGQHEQAGAKGHPQLPPIPPEGIDFPSVQRAFERHYIEQAVQMAGGNETQAARLLHINHHTFRYHRKKLQEEG